MPVLTRELVKLEGTAKYTTPHDARVVFASPLVDVAANIPKALPNIEDCKLILRHRHWQVRLLSKSALLQSVAAGGQIRWIASFTASARRHLTTAWRRVSRPAHRDLRTLAGVTFAPGQRLPHIRYDLSEPAEDYGAFVSHAAEAVRLDHCEHVWAEALNGRGESLRCITAALRTGADEKEAFALERVSSERLAWEEYACATFLAHSNVEPPEKLRFLQYVQPGPTELAAGTRSPGRCCWATMLFQPNRQTRRMIISHPFCRLTRHRWCTRMERPWRVVDSKETEKRDNNKQTDEL